jgi:hypothetical protein
MGPETISKSGLSTIDERSVTVRFRTLLILFAIETLAINLARLPESMRFDRYAFCDHGANLTLQYLLANGLRPTLDFGYTYGLLPALIGRIWFSVFGATPWAYQSAMVLVDLLCAWAMTNMLAHLRIGAFGLALAFITLGYAFQATYVNFAHAIEAVLLAHALAQHSRGSRSGALAFASAAVFAKPSMGYVYGLLLLILMARDLRQSGFNPRRLIVALAPAAVTFAGLSILLTLIYGPRIFAHTILPIEGAAHYRALNFGLMHSARAFWDPVGQPWVFYLVDMSGFWIVASVSLCLVALIQLPTIIRLGNPLKTHLTIRRSELIVTCALLHIAFLTLFFGNQWSWIYYSYILIAGIVITADFSPELRRLGAVLCVLGFFSLTDLAYWTHRWWQTTGPELSTAGLWAPDDERNEWLHVLATAHDRKTVVLDSMGAAELLFPDLGKPVSLYLLDGLRLPDEINRKVEALSQAQVVVVPITISACSGIPNAPEIHDALTRFDLAWSGKHFEVFELRPTTQNIQIGGDVADVQ